MMGFEQEALDGHNKYRALHGVPPLTLSAELCQVAQKWADHLAQEGKFEHSDCDYGENLAVGYGEKDAGDTCNTNIHLKISLNYVKSI